jgi:hypothetical protein
LSIPCACISITVVKFDPHWNETMIDTACTYSV